MSILQHGMDGKPTPRGEGFPVTIEGTDLGELAEAARGDAGMRPEETRLMRFLSAVEPFTKRGITDAELISAVSNAVHETELENAEGPRLFDIPAKDAEANHTLEALMTLERIRFPRYTRYILKQRLADGTWEAVPVPPLRLAGTEAAKQVVARWERERAEGPVGDGEAEGTEQATPFEATYALMVPLAVAVHTLRRLEFLYELGEAVGRMKGGLFEYPYTVCPSELEGAAGEGTPWMWKVPIPIAGITRNTPDEERERLLRERFREQRDNPDTQRADLFMGQLGAILGAIRGLDDTLSEAMAREVMEKAHAGSWEAVSGAATAIDGDHEAAIAWAQEWNGDILETLRDGAVTTQGKYRALASATTMLYQGDQVRLREAILAHRAATAPVSIVPYSPERKDTLTGISARNVFEQILQATTEDQETFEQSYPMPYETMRVSVTVPKVAREIIVGLPYADKTVEGLSSHYAAISQVWRDRVADAREEAARNGTPMPTHVGITARDVLKTQRDTASKKVRARNYKKPLETEAAIMEALSYVRVRIHYHSTSGRGGADIEFPLFVFSLRGRATDRRGNEIPDTWYCPTEAQSLEILDAGEALRLTSHLLPDGGGGTYDKTASAMYHMLMNRAEQFYRDAKRAKGKQGRANPLIINRNDLMNLGTVNPPLGEQDTQRKIHYHESKSVPEALAMTIPDVAAALMSENRDPIRIRIAYDERKPSRIAALIIEPAPDWKWATEAQKRRDEMAAKKKRRGRPRGEQGETEAPGTE